MIIIISALASSGSQGRIPVYQEPEQSFLLERTQNGRNPFTTKGDAGDETSSILDMIISQARRSEGVVIIISRLGEGEISETLHRRRLHNAWVRLVCYSTPIPREKVVTAMGDRVKGLGQVEFYYQGRLVYIAKLFKEQDFSVDCCGQDSRYYPWYKGNERECPS